MGDFIFYSDYIKEIISDIFIIYKGHWSKGHDKKYFTSLMRSHWGGKMIQNKFLFILSGSFYFVYLKSYPQFFIYKKIFQFYN